MRHSWLSSVWPSVTIGLKFDVAPVVAGIMGKSDAEWNGIRPVRTVQTTNDVEQGATGVEFEVEETEVSNCHFTMGRVCINS